MPFLLIEGIDRSGKSTAAEKYRDLGYEVVHLSAPDKKYSKPGYIGPGYVDEMLDLYMKYDGKDVVFDRTIYGELVWPEVFGRKPMLTEDDFELLADFEYRNNAEKLFFYDTNLEAHWKRCVDNNEPLTRSQFLLANKAYNKLVTEHGFKKTTLHDFLKTLPSQSQATASVEEEKPDQAPEVKTPVQPIDLPSHQPTKDKGEASELTEQQKRLQRANAIDSLLSKRIIKQRGEFFDSLELEVRSFLNIKLEEIMTGGTTLDNAVFSSEDLEILKAFISRIKQNSKA